MRVRRVSVIVALVGVFTLALANGAVAAATRVAGTTAEVVPSGTCSDPKWTGPIGTISCVGRMETWAGDISGTGTFDEAISLNFITGELQVSGEAVTNACVGELCGTLESTFHGSGRLDLETFAVIFIDGEQHFTGGAGDLEGAKGSIRFSLIGEGPATYGGFIVL